MSLKANPPEYSTCKATIIGIQLLYNVVYMCVCVYTHLEILCTACPWALGEYWPVTLEPVAHTQKKSQ